MKFYRHLPASTMVFAAVLLSGCASIISDSQYPVTMTTQPAGAAFQVRNETGDVIHQGTTPGTVTLKAGDGYFSKAHYTVVFEKEGYHAQTNTITPKVDGWYYANLIFGGLIGMLIIDPATGAMYKLPETSTAELESNPASAGVGQSLSIITTSALTEQQKASLIRIN